MSKPHSAHRDELCPYFFKRFGSPEAANAHIDKKHWRQATSQQTHDEAAMHEYHLDRLRASGLSVLGGDSDTESVPLSITPQPTNEE
jgi:hypothetical protein